MRQYMNSHLLVIVSLTLLVCSVTTISTAEEIAFYVSPEGNDSWVGDSIERPFSTIQKARDAVRALRNRGELTQPVTVYLRGGLYELDETIAFTVEDSGTREYPITYTAYKDEEPIVSGGRKIAGPWEDYEGEIKVCTIPEVKDGKWYFRQLFLNGQRQQRARIPNDGFYRTEGEMDRDSFKYKEDHFKDWNNLNGVEVVIFHSWNESKLLISELDEESRTVFFTGRIGRRGDNNRYYIENVLEGLDRPGEWYLERSTGKLYYWPDGDLDNAELRAPLLNELIRFEGDVDKKDDHIRYINIRGLTLCETSYILPEEGIPTIRDVGDIWFPSAITLKGVSHCSFEDNTVRNVGTYGIDLSGDAIHLIGNKIYDTGSGGIVTRSYGKYRNVISYNHIHDCGVVFHSGVGINIDDGGGLIANNLIHDTGHSGIYARHFGTDYGQEHERRNQEQGLIIEYNEIYNPMQLVNDGAGIFVRDDFVVIRNNLIHDSWTPPEGQGSPAWGIYLGCETRNCLVENNVVYRTEGGQHVWFQNKNNTIFNNIFVDGGRQQIDYNNMSNAFHHQIRLLRNIIYFSDSESALYDISGNGSLPAESNFNLIFNAKGQDLVIRGLAEVETFEDWQERGFEASSIIADPLFVDPENDDYSLRPDSPAFELGFKPIDLSRVGLRGRKAK